MAEAWVDGKPASVQAATDEAARLLAASRAPVIAGLGTDIAGARAAIALARQVGAAIDHMHSVPLLRDLDVLREAGMMLTTPNEARVRADVLLLVGPSLATAWPDLPQLFAAPRAPEMAGATRRIVWICPGRAAPAPAADGVALKTVGRGAADLPVLLAALRARLARRPAGKIGAPGKTLDALVADLESARFGVALWSAADLDALAIEMLCGIVKDLNAKTRFTGLPLGPADNAHGVLQVCGWTTTLPMRTGFARAEPEHDPWRFDAARLVADGEADCVLWISAYRPAAPDWVGDLPTIALTGRDAGFRRPPRVHIEVGRPGIDHDAVEHCARTGTLAPVTAVQPSKAVSAARVLAAIAAALPEAGAKSC